MLKIENLNKYFNKGKRNQIHIINNTTLEFNNPGIVALLGVSGSGKTTLLNVIGGLDKANKGKINLWQDQLCHFAQIVITWLICVLK